MTDVRDPRLSTIRQALDRLNGEVRPLDDHGQPRRNRLRPGAGAGTLWLVPAAVIVGIVVVLPTATLIWDSASTGDYWRQYATAFTDAQLLRDVRTTAIWAMAVPLLVTVAGYGFALLTRDIHLRFLLPMAFAPMALPMVVIGVAFRTLYAPSPSLGPATAIEQAVAGLFGVPPERVTPLLGERLVTPALISAFFWAWMWLAAVMFRAALDQIPPDLEGVVRSEGGGYWHVLRDVQLPFLRRTFAILVILLAVMASRTFDLVLIMAPGSVQHVAEVLGLYVLRQPNVAAPGEANVVGVVWFAVVGVGVLLGARGVRYDWPAPAVPKEKPGKTRNTPGRLARRVALFAVIAVWAFPAVLLVLVSFSDPISVATGGWLGQWSRAAYDSLVKSGVLETLVPTLLLAILVALCVVVMASVAAYSLAWLQPYGSALATGVLLVTAVVPIQVTAGTLHDALVPLEQQGTMLTAAIVHIGRGLPLAILVLRNAFGAVPPDQMAFERLNSRSEFVVMLRRVVPAARPALIAVAALEFILVWNDLVVGFLFGGSDFTPIAVALFGQSRQFTTSVGVLTAGSVVASIVPVAVAILARKAIVAGLISGVVKR
ncbi:MAG TPA: hypothetical protein VFC19_53325 [Candidatus Limnocylindrales bacterium]|nr:hypothetical protein [Candidatus Limnocylindrales bacterium]